MVAGAGLVPVGQKGAGLMRDGVSTKAKEILAVDDADMASFFTQTIHGEDRTTSLFHGIDDREVEDSILREVEDTRTTTDVIAARHDLISGILSDHLSSDAEDFRICSDEGSVETVLELSIPKGTNLYTKMHDTHLYHSNSVVQPTRLCEVLKLPLVQETGLSSHSDRSDPHNNSSSRRFFRRVNSRISVHSSRQTSRSKSAPPSAKESTQRHERRSSSTPRSTTRRQRLSAAVRGRVYAGCVKVVSVVARSDLSRNRSITSSSNLPPSLVMGESQSALSPISAPGGQEVACGQTDSSNNRSTRQTKNNTKSNIFQSKKQHREGRRGFLQRFPGRVWRTNRSDSSSRSSQFRQVMLFEASSGEEGIEENSVMEKNKDIQVGKKGQGISGIITCCGECEQGSSKESETDVCKSTGDKPEMSVDHSPRPPRQILVHRNELPSRISHPETRMNTKPRNQHDIPLPSVMPPKRKLVSLVESSSSSAQASTKASTQPSNQNSGSKSSANAIDLGRLSVETQTKKTGFLRRITRLPSLPKSKKENKDPVKVFVPKAGESQMVAAASVAAPSTARSRNSKISCHHLPTIREGRSEKQTKQVDVHVTPKAETVTSELPGLIAIKADSHCSSLRSEINPIQVISRSPNKYGITTGHPPSSEFLDFRQQSSPAALYSSDDVILSRELSSHSRSLRRYQSYNVPDWRHSEEDVRRIRSLSPPHQGQRLDRHGFYHDDFYHRNSRTRTISSFERSLSRDGGRGPTSSWLGREHSYHPRCREYSDRQRHRSPVSRYEYERRYTRQSRFPHEDEFQLIERFRSFSPESDRSQEHLSSFSPTSGQCHERVQSFSLNSGRSREPTRSFSPASYRSFSPLSESSQELIRSFSPVSFESRGYYSRGRSPRSRRGSSRNEYEREGYHCYRIRPISPDRESSFLSLSIYDHLEQRKTERRRAVSPEETSSDEEGGRTVRSRSPPAAQDNRGWNLFHLSNNKNEHVEMQNHFSEDNSTLETDFETPGASAHGGRPFTRVAVAVAQSLKKSAETADSFLNGMEYEKRIRSMSPEGGKRKQHDSAHFLSCR